MIVIGCDPGIHGGLAVVDRRSDRTKLLEAIDIPVAGVDAKERVDAQAIYKWALWCRANFAFIERAQAMPKQGSSSGFKYGRAVGAIEAALQLAQVPLSIIEPSAWKKFHHIHSREKEASRQKALLLFPDRHDLFARKKDHGRAEAALIALYGALR